MPSEDDTKDPKGGRRRTPSWKEGTFHLHLSKGKWMLQRGGRHAENASPSVPQRPYPAPLFIYSSHSISLALCWAPGKHRYVSLFFSTRSSWSGGWWESKLLFPHQTEATGSCGWGRDRGRSDLSSLLSGEKANPSEASGGCRSPVFPAHPPAGLLLDHCLCQPKGGARTLGWLEMLFSSLFYTQCPRKTFC